MLMTEIEQGMVEPCNNSLYLSNYVNTEKYISLRTMSKFFWVKETIDMF